MVEVWLLKVKYHKAGGSTTEVVSRLAVGVVRLDQLGFKRESQPVELIEDVAGWSYICPHPFRPKEMTAYLIKECVFESVCNVRFNVSDIPEKAIAIANSLEANNVE